MANRLRSSTARISFFAFQDVITTVTGVLLLITLLLTFYLNEPQSSTDEAARNAVREQLERARATLATSLAELRKHPAEPKIPPNRVYVIPAPDPSGKKPVLVALSATNGWCHALGQSNAVEFVQRSDNADFRRLLDSWDPARQRLVFYIRPSGIAQFAVCRKLAAERSFSYGYDAAEEDKQYRLAAP
jgi:hypothetical protein